MTVEKKEDARPARTAAEARKARAAERLASALRDNLRRRKEQARARQAPGAPPHTNESEPE